MGETWPALNVQQHVTIIFVSCRARPSRIQGCGHLDSTSLSKLVRQCRAGIRGIRETRVCTRSSVIVFALRKTVDTRLLPFYGIRVDDSIDSI